jgi:hypothetical protein
VEAVGGEIGIPSSVVLEGAPGGVECVAIDLDHHTFVAPEEVDFVGAEADVGLGRRQPRSSNEGQEAALRLGAGKGRIRLDQTPEARSTAMSWVAGDEGDELSAPHEMLGVRLGERSLQVAGGGGG